MVVHLLVGSPALEYFLVGGVVHGWDSRVS